MARPARNRVRIIGGRHRGRKLEFPELPGLRVVEAESVEVHVEVDVAPVERTFTQVPIEAIGLTYETTVTPTQTSVTPRMSRNSWAAASTLRGALSARRSRMVLRLSFSATFRV